MLSGYDVSKSNEKKPVSRIQQALKQRIVSGCRVGMIAALGVALTAFCGITMAETDSRPNEPSAEVSFSEGLAAVTIARYAFIDKTGKVVIDSGFKMIGEFSDELAPVVFNNKVGYIDKTGKVVIEPRFDWAGKFYHGYAMAELDGKRGFINKSGKIIIEPQFNDISLFDDFPDDLVPVELGRKWGFSDKNGKMVIEPQFDDAGNFFDNLAPVKKNDKWG